MDDSRFESESKLMGRSYNSKTVDSPSKRSLKRNRGNRSYAIVIKSGIIVNNFIHFYSGIRYREGIDETILECLVCSYLPTETIRLENNFLEIPLGFRLNLIKNSRLQPYVSSEIFWVKRFSQKKKTYSCLEPLIIRALTYSESRTKQVQRIKLAIIEIGKFPFNRV